MIYFSGPNHTKYSMAFHSLSIAFIFFVATFLTVPVARSIPFITLHGLNDDCQGIQWFTSQLRDFSGSLGYCIEIGNGKLDSVFKPLTEQTQIACDTVKALKELSEGYNIVAQSQGNLIARGLIEFCDGGPPVKNYISLGGPHAGIASVPECGSDIFCKLIHSLLKADVYSDFIQDMVAPSGYIKIPSAFPLYLEKCKFLPKLNNERPDNRNSSYKERFSSLQSLVLIMFNNDTVLLPKETSWFGYYPDGASQPVLPTKKTQLYTEDWIGLRTLDEAGKVQFVTVSGAHLQITTDDIKNYIVPYLVDQASAGRGKNKNSREYHY